MKIAIIGAGTQAKAVLDYLTRFAKVTTIGVVDINNEAADKLLSGCKIPKSKFIGYVDSDEFVSWLSYFDAAISCAPYFLNETLTKQAIRAKTHLTDLGGNNDVVKAQLALSEEAKAAGVLVVPDLGLAPGMAGLLGADLVRSLGYGKKELSLRVGGLPVRPKTVLNYGLSFSIHGLINEYLEDCDVIEDGVRKTVPGLSGVRPVDFPCFLYEGQLESFNTSGGSSTLPETLLGEVDFLDYKTIRYKGHRDFIFFLQQLGYFAPELIEDTKRRLEEFLPKNEEDKILMYLWAKNITTDELKTISLSDRGDVDRGLSAMSRCTGYPAAIITSMIARGDVTARGVIPQENCIDVKIFKKLLHETGINLNFDGY